jgi:hypothetical protein
LCLIKYDTGKVLVCINTDNLCDNLHKSAVNEGFICK